jgi:hypothetical protein
MEQLFEEEEVEDEVEEEDEENLTETEEQVRWLPTTSKLSRLGFDPTNNMHVYKAFQSHHLLVYESILYQYGLQDLELNCRSPTILIGVSSSIIYFGKQCFKNGEGNIRPFISRSILCSGEV